MIGRWTIFTTPVRSNTLHVAIASALWARVPEPEMSIWYGKTNVDYQEEPWNAIHDAVKDGFAEFTHIPNYTNPKDVVYLWNLCRYFREKASSSDPTHILIHDDVYLKRHSRFGVKNWLVLSGWITTFHDLARNHRQEDFTFALLSTREIPDTNRKIYRLPDNKCYGVFPRLDFRLGIYTPEGCQILLEHLLNRMVHCGGKSPSVLDYILGDLTWNPGGAFFSYYSLVETYRRQYD